MTDPLQLATDNAVSMWMALGAARGYQATSGDGFVCVSGEPTGRRIMIRSPAPDAAEIGRLVGEAPSRLVVEDSFSTLDGPALTAALTSRQMPVMVRHGQPALAALHLPVRRVMNEADLRLAERLIVTGFTLELFEPYEPGRAFPTSMLNDPATAFFVVERDGEPAGACLTLTDDHATGFYWVTTVPEHRSHGVGRALMHGAISHLDAGTVTLTASAAGQPLYDSMDFDVVGASTWWSRPPN